MAEAAVLKKQCSTAKQKFTRKFNILTELIEKSGNISEINVCFDDLNSAWQAVEQKYDQYLNVLTEQELPAAEEWINTIQTSYSSIRKSVILLRNEVESSKSCEYAKRAFIQHENIFDETRNNIISMITSRYLPESLISERGLLISQFERYSEAHTNYLLVASDQTREELVTKMKTHVEHFNNTKTMIDKYILTFKSESEKKTELSPSPRTFHLEKMPLPKFDGVIRNYPQFKKDFKNLVLTNIDSKGAAFTLRNCLSSDVRDFLGCCDDVPTMFERLDIKYGDPCKIMESIVSEIHKFKKLDIDDPKKIIQFVDIIDKAHRDLKSLDLESEIANANTISLIENKLPRVIQMAWYREIYKEGSKVEKTAKFSELLKFLITERNALEYATSDLRKDARPPQTHIYTALGADNISCIIHFWSGNHTTSNCRTYVNLSLDNKYKVLNEKSACYGCLSVGHNLNECTVKRVCSDSCSKYHHPSLHTDETRCTGNTVSDANSNFEVLLPVMKIRTVSKNCKSVSCLWDAGADISFITNTKARELKLRGKPVKLSMTTAGGETKVIESVTYYLELIDKFGNTHNLRVFGIDKITGPIADVDLGAALKLFDNIRSEDIVRPSGEVDVLIGYDYAGWHPTPEAVREHLVILNNIFGKCIGGRGSMVKKHLGENVLAASKINNVKVETILNQFFDIESLGVQCEPKCGNCRCGTCPIGGKPYSLKEERELKMIETNLEFKGSYWITSYPWLKDPNLLPNNYDYALKRLKSTEYRLNQNKLLKDMYISQINDMVERGVARKLSENEINDYAGPVHYIAHHSVMKSESLSTPLRIVFDSSHDYQGHSLNSYWAKGPDAYMNNLLSVLLKFRENEIGIVGDIRKMYNSVYIKILEQHVHRFLWRNVETQRPPDTYVITAVNMGDRPSGTIATVALRKTAHLENESHPKAAEIVVESSYVDDIVDSVDTVEEARKVTNDISELLKRGNFYLKGWSISGLPKSIDNPRSQETQKVLGLNWNPESDVIQFNMELKFSKYPNKSKQGDSVTGNIPSVLTKRIVLSQLNGIYDPLGFLVPWTIKGKLLMRNLWAKQLGWDTPLCDENRTKWTYFLKEMFQASLLKFPRSVRPPDASSKSPVLITFSDASKEAFGCCGYIRWQLNNGSFQSRLIAGKSRVAPLKTTTIVRLELSAAVLAKRLRSFIEESFRLTFGRVIHIIDSQIVKAMIKSDSYGFNTFVATRVGEIQAKTDPDEWYWVESKFNVADVISRGVDINELDRMSTWQNGPDFLSLPIDDWPINNDFVLSEELPERSVYVHASSASPKGSPVVDIHRFSNYMRLLRVTARILSLRNSEPRRSLYNLKIELKPQHLECAKLFWEKEAQNDILNDLQEALSGKGILRKLNIQKLNGVYFAIGRTEALNDPSYNRNKLIVLPGNHRYVELYARHLHENAHLGVNADIAKIRSEYWVIGIHRLVKLIKRDCIVCRKYHGRLLDQIMAPLPIERLKPAPVWHYTALDLFGPYQMKGEVNKRSLGKGYGVIFTCLLTRAVFIDIATDYSTDAFLLVFRRFVSVRGYPAKIFSDPGSQLKSASKELNEMFESLNWEAVQASAAQKGLEWKFTPAEAPWYNGCCEALIRSVKKSICHAIGNQHITFPEMQTVLYESANIVNERPIGVTHKSVEDGTYLCPNDLLLGRSTNKVPTGNFAETINSRRRLYFIQRIIDSFWKKWTSDYFPSLLERPKWHQKVRNMRVGDVVIIQDKSLKRSQWKLGVVTEVYNGCDKMVRHVKVKYTNPSTNFPIEIERPIQRLVLILAVEEYDSEEVVPELQSKRKSR